MHNTPLRDTLSVFLGASKVILGVVLYFRLLAFAIDIFTLQYMSGKNNDSSKSRHASPQGATEQHHAKPFAQ